jgi:hypothetical protein
MKTQMIFLTTYFLYSSMFLFSKSLQIAIMGGSSEQRSRFETELSEKKYIQIIERANLDKVLNEIKLSQLGVLKEGSYKKTGELLGADYLVILELNSPSFRLVESNSAKILGVWKDSSFNSMKKFFRILDKEQAITELLELPNQSSDLKISFTIKNKYRIGEDLSFKLKVESSKKEKVHLFILVYGSDGVLTQIFPNSFDKRSEIFTNQDFIFPTKTENPYKIKISPPIGEDEYIFITSKEKIEFSKEQQDDFISFEEDVLEKTKAVKFQLDKKKNFTLEKIKIQVLDK